MICVENHARTMESDAYWDYSGWYVALSADGLRVAISAINHGNPPGAGKLGNIVKRFKGASPRSAPTSD